MSRELEDIEGSGSLQLTNTCFVLQTKSSKLNYFIRWMNFLGLLQILQKFIPWFHRLSRTRLTIHIHKINKIMLVIAYLFNTIQIFSLFCDMLMHSMRNFQITKNPYNFWIINKIVDHLFFFIFIICLMSLSYCHKCLRKYLHKTSYKIKKTLVYEILKTNWDIKIYLFTSIFISLFNTSLGNPLLW